MVGPQTGALVSRAEDLQFGSASGQALPLVSAKNKSWESLPGAQGFKDSLWPRTHKVMRTPELEDTHTHSKSIRCLDSKVENTN